ncbi:hypothetical protein JMJ77_0010991 [Colletotrichum scovillei]|uniref:Uncharacterized protein n=1 Tax=Colletotrichum scovillei TaxID=1209932 RepID=A0A9P7R4T0_9PEZI|nr:hypothetical protein JMJ77_0010991 [Colletotrichum scovillei]KAG7059958.1 hypothetical protein JMJ78_0015242 [Colletotrichum scovillei]KAG7067410.1 hypothetical protein JMJ76_0008847 [Colletotrichum scovillei]
MARHFRYPSKITVPERHLTEQTCFISTQVDQNVAVHKCIEFTERVSWRTF